MFSYTFAMLLMALIVSKDRQTFFLKRLYSSPMRAKDFVLGYAIVGFIIRVCQTVVCFLAGGVIALVTKQSFIGLGGILLLFVSQMPILVFFVFAGILIGTTFNDKTAPGICSILISVAGVLGGCWMPLDAMGGFETICRIIPFYPSVYIGRVVTGAKTILNTQHAVNGLVWWGIVTICAYALVSVISAFIIFKDSMTKDN
jgi:ABC-2 type transport system permease protein